GGALRPPAHREPGRALPAPGAWPASRAVAPGTAAHGPALQLLPQSAGAGLPGRSAHPAGAARRAAALAWPPRRAGGNRPRRRRLRLRLRTTASQGDRKSTRLNSSHVKISYAVFCLKKKKKKIKE